MHPTINTIIFDCFGVICDPLLVGWYKENSTKHGFTDETFKTLVDEFNLGNITEDDVIDRFSKYEGITSTKEEIQKEIVNHLRLNESLVSTIKELKAKGYTIVLLTNANHLFFETYLYPKYPDFTSLFERMIISSSVKMIKPHKDIFMYTLKTINKKPEEIVFVDDTEENVDMAKSLGIQSIVYTNNQSLLQDFTELGLHFR
jgi:putative hydrolase of the HAD superfamily